MSEIAVVGAGAWGTALALHAARAGHLVTLWARHPDRISAENPRLPGVAIPSGIAVTGTLPDAADAVLVAVPMQHLSAILQRMRAPSSPLLLCCKGLESATGLLPLEVAAANGFDTAAVLTGPNFAAEVAAGRPAASVVAAESAALRQHFCTLLATARFRLYGNADAVGAQLGGAAKNVMAIAAGVVIGAGLGENARAALVTRGLAEIARLATALGGKAETVAGLSGLGDLVLTCTGPSSRNFAYGLALGRGAAPASLVSEDGPVIEGIATAPALLARAAEAELPICRAVADLVCGRLGVAEVIEGVLSRPVRDE
jgi:glycerol-3-phosphate dehydrogenase (NAD(P)+)